MKGVHGEKRFACDACDYKTAYSKSFEDHKLLHASKVECPICKKQVNALKVHMLTHLPKEPCAICGKEVLRKNMKLHMKVHKKYNCENCSEVFDSRENWRR